MKDTIVLRVYRTTSRDTIRNTDPFGKGFREDAFLKYPITWDRSWRGEMRRGAGVICLSGSKLLGNEPAIYLSDALLAIYKINGLVCALSLNKYRLVTI